MVATCLRPVSGQKLRPRKGAKGCFQGCEAAGMSSWRLGSPSTCRSPLFEYVFALLYIVDLSQLRFSAASSSFSKASSSSITFLSTSAFRRIGEIATLASTTVCSSGSARRSSVIKKSTSNRFASSMVVASHSSIREDCKSVSSVLWTSIRDF